MRRRSRDASLLVVPETCASGEAERRGAVVLVDPSKEDPFFLHCDIGSLADVVDGRDDFVNVRFDELLGTKEGLAGSAYVCLL